MRLNSPNRHNNLPKLRFPWSVVLSFSITYRTSYNVSGVAEIPRPWSGGICTKHNKIGNPGLSAVPSFQTLLSGPRSTVGVVIDRVSAFIGFAASSLLPASFSLIPPILVPCPKFAPGRQTQGSLYLFWWFVLINQIKDFSEVDLVHSSPPLCLWCILTKPSFLNLRQGR